jgi:hypothetical protein
MKTAGNKRRKLLVCQQSVTREGPQEEESEERRSSRSKYLVVAGGKAFKKVRGQKSQQTNNKRSPLRNPCSLIGEAVKLVEFSVFFFFFFFFYLHNRLQIAMP